MLLTFVLEFFFFNIFLQAISLLDFQKQRTDNNTVVSMTDCALCKYSLSFIKIFHMVYPEWTLPSPIRNNATMAASATAVENLL